MSANLRLILYISLQPLRQKLFLIQKRHDKTLSYENAGNKSPTRAESEISPGNGISTNLLIILNKVYIHLQQLHDPKGLNLQAAYLYDSLF
jgi:hypothetical protein